MGQRLTKHLPHADLILLKAPKADEVDAEALSDRTRHAETLIAVGSGTLNDLCKIVSHRRGRPYLVFPTAPSMNGYTTATASISRAGEKLSLSATPPMGVFCDLDVLTRAPARLIRAGVGDSLCRSTAQVDWLLSHHLRATAYSETPFDLQQDAEQALIQRAGSLLDGDREAMRALIELLVLGGLGMLIIGNSQPGSQGEHLISHYLDMFLQPHPGSLHGEQVGLATWTMAFLQTEVFCNTAAPTLRATAIDTESMQQRAGPLSASFEQAMRAKAVHGDDLDRINEDLEQRWPTLRKKLTAAALPADVLKKTFDAVGVVTDPETLRIDQTFYAQAIRHARELRDRYTMLDFAGDAGLLDPFIERHLHGKSASFR